MLRTGRFYTSGFRQIWILSASFKYRMAVTTEIIVIVFRFIYADVSEEFTVSLFYRENGGTIFLWKIGKFLNRIMSQSHNHLSCLNTWFPFQCYICQDIIVIIINISNQIISFLGFRDFLFQYLISMYFCFLIVAVVVFCLIDYSVFVDFYCYCVVFVLLY
jgi:hypothetical protein